MSRVGRFGRGPRSAPNITDSVVAMAREYEAARERNITDAWKNGGEFEGHKVTDEMILSFYADKEKSLDHADPMWQEAHNTREQYVFAVANSKHELLYHQHKLNDHQMSSFYLSEASKHPRDSEIYRQLMSLGADYADRGRAAANRGTSGSKAAAHAKTRARIETPLGVENAYTALTNHLLDVARMYHITNSGENPDTGSGGETFTDLQVWQGDFSNMEQVIAEYATSTDPAIVADRKAWTAYIAKNFVPGFKGDFSLQGILAIQDGAGKAAAARLADALANGTPAEVKALRKTIGTISSQRSVMASIPLMDQYEQGRKQWESEMQDPNGTIATRHDATEAWKTQLTGIATQFRSAAFTVEGPGSPGDGGLLAVRAGRALCELGALNGDSSQRCDTLAEESRPNVSAVGSQNSDPMNSDAFSTAFEVNRERQDLMNLVTHPNDFVMAHVDPNTHKPTLDPKNYITGVVAKADIAAAGIPVMYVPSGDKTTTVTGPDGKPTTQPLGTTFTAVYGQTLITNPYTSDNARDQTGRPIDTGLPTLAGERPDIGAKFMIGDTPVYQLYAHNGAQMFIIGSPFITGPDGQSLVQEHTNAKGQLEVSWRVGATIPPGYQGYDVNQMIAKTITDPAATGSGTPKFTVAHSMTEVLMLSGSPINGTGGRRLLTDNEIAASVYGESGGNPATYNALYQSAIAVRDQVAKQISDATAYREQRRIPEVGDAATRQRALAIVNAQTTPQGVADQIRAQTQAAFGQNFDPNRPDLIRPAGPAFDTLTGDQPMPLPAPPPVPFGHAQQAISPTASAPVVPKAGNATPQSFAPPAPPTPPALVAPPPQRPVPPPAAPPPPPVVAPPVGNATPHFVPPPLPPPPPKPPGVIRV